MRGQTRYLARLYSDGRITPEGLERMPEFHSGNKVGIEVAIVFCQQSLFYWGLNAESVGAHGRRVSRRSSRSGSET